MHRVVWLALIGVLVAGCCHHAQEPDDEDETIPLPTKVAGARDIDEMAVRARLLKRGVYMLSMGQNYLLSIPAGRLFAYQSPRLLWRSYDLLNDVVCYLKQYRKVSINITAFAGKYISSARDRALTSDRARNVADYLWSQDIDSRFVFTRGLGSDKPMRFGQGEGDSSPNARIEITFRDAVV